MGTRIKGIPGLTGLFSERNFPVHFFSFYTGCCTVSWDKNFTVYTGKTGYALVDNRFCAPVSPAKMAAKRVDLSLADKVKIVRESELPGVSQASLARKYGVSTSQVSRLVKNKHELTEALESGGNQRRKHMCEGKEEDVGKALFLWFEQKTAQGARLSGPVLKQKASDLARAQGSDFFPSDGWLSRWKVRHNVVFRKEHGEKQSADLQSATDWKRDVLPQILGTFSEDDIYNADETGLYFRGYPDRGHCIKGTELAGGGGGGGGKGERQNHCSTLH